MLSAGTRLGPYEIESLVGTGGMDTMATGLLAAAHRLNGNRPRADALLEKMGADPNPVWGRVWYHLNLGELDAAADSFETMIERRDPFALVYANAPVTQRLHRHPRWARIARLMRLPVTVGDQRG